MKLVDISPILIALTIVASACKGGDEPIHPVNKPIKEAVYASGNIQSVGEHTIYAQKSGKLVSKQVLEGSTFNQGQLLFILDDGLTSPRFKSTRLANEIAQINAGSGGPVLSEMDNRIAELRKVVEFDSTNFNRYRNLWKENATSRIDYDKASLAYEKSKRGLSQAIASRTQLANKTSLELRNAQTQLEQLNEEYGFFQVKAPVRGTLFKVFKEPGEFVKAGEPLAIIGSDSSFICKLKIDEQDLMKVQVGMAVLLKADAFTNKVLHGKIVQVYPIVDPRDQSVTVDAVLDEPLPRNFTGIAVEANILVRESESALVIPQQYLLPGDSVLLKTDGDVKTIKVITGIKSLDEVEIRKGLSKDSQLVLP